MFILYIINKGSDTTLYTRTCRVSKNLFKSDDGMYLNKRYFKVTS